MTDQRFAIFSVAKPKVNKHMASTAEIAVALESLFAVMPAPRGVNPDKAFNGYVTALSGFGVEEIDEAIRRYLSAEWPDISLKFYPRAPELAHICRLVRSEHASEHERQRRIKQLALDREADAEAEKLRIHTPEQKARVAALLAEFHAATEDEEARQRAEAREAERARIRAAYGMTEEVLAGVKDRPLPKGMKHVADAAKKAVPPLQKKPPPEDFGGLS